MVPFGVVEAQAGPLRRKVEVQGAGRGCGVRVVDGGWCAAAVREREREREWRPTGDVGLASGLGWMVGGLVVVCGGGPGAWGCEKFGVVAVGREVRCFAGEVRIRDFARRDRQIRAPPRSSGAGAKLGRDRPSAFPLSKMEVPSSSTEFRVSQVLHEPPSAHFKK